MYYGLPLGSIHSLYFECTNAVTLHCAKVGGSMDQGPTTQVNHRLNQPSNFCSVVLEEFLGCMVVKKFHECSQLGLSGIRD